MSGAELDAYCQLAIDSGATGARQVQPASVTTAPWVRWKCQFGCTGYNRSYTCPPDSPTPEQTRAMLDSYRRGILVHTQAPHTPDILERRAASRKMLVDLEAKMFLDGYYKAFVLLSGSCALCGGECAKVRGEPCKNGLRVRPSMEACGIDVYRTARNSGFPVNVLQTRTDTRNYFALLLVD